MGGVCGIATTAGAARQAFPDLVMIRDRRILFCELKSERGRVREEQQDWLQALNRAGAEWYVWRPRNWDEVVEVLR